MYSLSNYTNNELLVYHLSNGIQHYIGTTYNIEKTMYYVSNNIVPHWVKLHNISILTHVFITNKSNCVNINNCHLANCKTYELMGKYGINNVRGGIWGCINLFDGICNEPIIDYCNIYHNEFIYNNFFYY